MAVAHVGDGGSVYLLPELAKANMYVDLATRANRGIRRQTPSGWISILPLYSKCVCVCVY